ncbi:MAG: cupin domain-containing protein [Methylobacter sp.]|nr:cupin domain-containing protein [Methylobacter sp.]MDP2100446.1 cupin domain-containing protein [Methylobacter sp.]MDP2428306.1 cupin domain-containing protein [Methylobacter sp.]MDP3055657.1 cupin domain-containing protein [Methylobacter sp.]MDP3361407.1 cupin domain-containing protein [Methylobacter sp.]
MFKISSTKALPVVLIALLLSPLAPVAAQEKTGMNRAVLLEKELQLPSPNIDAKVIRVTFPFGFKTPWHTHEGPGPRYVVKGQLKVVEGGKENTYAAGDVFWETGALMSVENVGDAEAELIIFELAPVK